MYGTEMTNPAPPWSLAGRAGAMLVLVMIRESDGEMEQYGCSRRLDQIRPCSWEFEFFVRTSHSVDTEFAVMWTLSWQKDDGGGGRIEGSDDEEGLGLTMFTSKQFSQASSCGALPITFRFMLTLGQAGGHSGPEYSLTLNCGFPGGSTYCNNQGGVVYEY